MSTTTDSAVTAAPARAKCALCGAERDAGGMTAYRDARYCGVERTKGYREAVAACIARMVAQIDAARENAARDAAKAGPAQEAAEPQQDAAEADDGGEAPAEDGGEPESAPGDAPGPAAAEDGQPEGATAGDCDE